ncbi:MAG: NAD(P)/FAD-dependent oxidoreductase [Acidimicrobiales bacterium]
MHGTSTQPSASTSGAHSGTAPDEFVVGGPARASRRYDVAVVGGGITGCATAYHLACAGASVVLAERGEVGTEASGRNAGSLHGQIQREPFERFGPGWARDFLPALRFLLDALEMWGRLDEELGTDLEVRTKGGLLLADDPAQMQLIEEKVRVEQEAGLDAQVLSRADVMALAPYVSERVVGAEYSPVEGKANPMLATPAFARAAARAGAEIRARCALVDLEMKGQAARLTFAASEGGRTETQVLEAERVVLASGDALAYQVRSLEPGLALPISSEPVQVAATEPVQPFIEHLLYYAGQRLTLKQAKAGTVLVGGGWPARLERGTGYPLVRLDSMRANLAVALGVVPRLGSALVLRSWAGIGNGTPDHRPVLGVLRRAPRVVVGLFPHMGFTAGPLMGRVLADLAVERQPELDLAPFSPERFATS